MFSLLLAASGLVTPDAYAGMYLGVPYSCIVDTGGCEVILAPMTGSVIFGDNITTVAGESTTSSTFLDDLETALSSKSIGDDVAVVVDNGSGATSYLIELVAVEADAQCFDGSVTVDFIVLASDEGTDDIPCPPPSSKDAETCCTLCDGAGHPGKGMLGRSKRNAAGACVPSCNCNNNCPGTGGDPNSVFENDCVI